MKKILFSLSLMFCLALGLQAQQTNCSKACTAKAGKGACEMKVASAQVPVTTEFQMAAAKVASLDASIEGRTNPTTGEVTYFKRETNAQTGLVSFTALNFDTVNNTFVSLGTTSAAYGSGSAQSANGSANTQGCGAHATAATPAKSCCAAGANHKACSADKAKSASAANTNSESTKPAKNGGSN